MIPHNLKLFLQSQGGNWGLVSQVLIYTYMFSELCFHELEQLYNTLVDVFL